MSDPSDITFAIKNAAWSFKKERADYYAYVAAIVKSSGGSKKILDIFEDDLQRYGNKPKGVLSAFWYERYAGNGGNLADTWEGTFPEDEIAIIRVAQNAGSDALLRALDDVARLSHLSDEIKSESIGTVFVASISMVMAMGMITIFPIIASDFLSKSYDFIPYSYWSESAKNAHSYAEWIKSNIVFVVIGIAAIIFGAFWSINNFVGPVRNWLDENFFIYRTIRDLKGALFLSTMSTLTRRRDGVMFNQRKSLELFSHSAKSNWLRWRLEEVIEGSDESGAVGVDAFRTGLISSEMFYFLQDMQQANGFSDGFQATGKYVEGTLLKSIIKRMVILRWVLFGISLGLVFYVLKTQAQVITDMGEAMKVFLSSN